MDFRQTLLECTTVEEFKRLIITHSQELAEEQQLSHDKQHITINHDGLEDNYVSLTSHRYTYSMECGLRMAKLPKHNNQNVI